jgi:hypothetical protein
VAVLTAAVLVITVKAQIFDTNFYSLWEATALLAGDHPYRDFFEWGIPGQMVVSAAAQWLAGYRLIGEFALQWAFIVAAMVIGFAMACRVSRSTAAALGVMLVALIVVAGTPIYHYPKLFFYPALIALGWRYLDRPGPGIGAVLGLLTAAAFFFRHDHGVYLAAGSVLTFVLALVKERARPLRAAVADAAAYTVAAAVVIVPWLIVVQRTEGVVDYLQSRLLLGQGDAAPPASALYRTMLSVHPLPILRGAASELDALIWIEQISLAVPLLLLASLAVDVVVKRLRGRAMPADSFDVVLASAFLAGLGLRLFREPSYATMLVPATAALGSRFLTRAWWPVRSVAAAVLLVSAVAGALVLRTSPIAHPAEALDELPRMFGKLTSHPPIDAFMTDAELNRYDRNAPAAAAEPLPLELLMRYMRECTHDGDRILVTGSTPFQVGYLVERPIAGGHLYWHKGWRNDEAHEAQSLAMLRRQSVPFAISTQDPVLEDLKVYPRIHAEFSARYAELPESGGRVLVEKARPVTREFGPLRFPCFN